MIVFKINNIKQFVEKNIVYPSVCSILKRILSIPAILLLLFLFLEAEFTHLALWGGKDTDGTPSVHPPIGVFS